MLIQIYFIYFALTKPVQTVTFYNSFVFSQCSDACGKIILSSLFLYTLVDVNK